MNKEQQICWFSGLFEGEGSFMITKEKLTKGICITSTDLDVLEKVKHFFGGKISSEKEARKKEWKIAYKWTLSKEESKLLVKDIYPYLLKRRRERADFYIKLDKELDARRQLKIERDKKIITLYKEGVSQGKIGEILHLHRTSITKIIKMVGIT